MFTSSIERLRVLKPVEWRFGDELQPGRAQLLEQRAQRDPSRPASCSRSASEKPEAACPP